MRFGRPGRWTLFRIAVGVALGAGFLWWVWRDVDNRALGERLTEFPPSLLLVVFGLLILSAGLRAYRWSLLFPSHAPPVWRLFFVETTGIAFNNVSPVRVLAEPVQFAYLTVRYGHDTGTVIGSLVLVRVIDLVMTLSMIVVGFMVFRPEAALPRSVWAGIGLFALVAFVVVSASLLSGRSNWARRFSFVGPYATVWRDLSQHPRKLGSVMVATVGFWMIKGAAANVIAFGLDIDLSIALVHVLMLAVTTLGLTLPGLPSGLGPFEFAATFFLPLYGVMETDALAFGLVLHGTFLLPAIVIAVATLATIGPPCPRPRAADAGPRAPGRAASRIATACKPSAF